MQHGHDEGSYYLHSSMPRHLLSQEERLRLSPCLARQMAQLTESHSPQLHLNKNYKTVTSRYSARQIDRILPPGVSPIREGEQEQQRQSSPAHQQQQRRSTSASMRLFANVHSRYLDDPRLSPSRSATPRVDPARTNSPARTASVAPPPVISSPPFRSGVRCATPDEVRRRNQALLRCAGKHVAESVVKQFIAEPRPYSQPRSRTPDRTQSPRSRSPRPKPMKPALVEEERYLQAWREHTSHCKVHPEHIPRVATLSIGFQLQEIKHRASSPITLKWTSGPSTVKPTSPEPRCTSTT